MASISETDISEFNKSVEYFIINCSKKIMYYHADDFKEDGFDVSEWINETLVDIYLDENLLPYDYKNFIKTKLTNVVVIKSTNNEISNNTEETTTELEDYSFKSSFFRYCHFYAKNNLYDTLLEMTQAYIEEISSYSDDDDEDDYDEDGDE